MVVDGQCEGALGVVAVRIRLHLVTVTGRLVTDRPTMQAAKGVPLRVPARRDHTAGATSRRGTAVARDRRRHEVRVFSGGKVVARQRIQTVGTSGAPRPAVMARREVRARLVGRVPMRLFDVAVYVVVLVAARARPISLVVSLAV